MVTIQDSSTTEEEGEAASDTTILVAMAMANNNNNNHHNNLDTGIRAVMAEREVTLEEEEDRLCRGGGLERNFVGDLGACDPVCLSVCLSAVHVEGKGRASWRLHARTKKGGWEHVCARSKNPGKPRQALWLPQQLEYR